MILVSRCLLGMNCRFDGKSKLNEGVIKFLEGQNFISICPEQLGGLPILRIPSEQKEGRVISESGEDVTRHFIGGAYEVLRIVREYGAREAILKQRSPSCGCGQIYDGTFSGTIIEGDGVTTALLKRNGIKVISEEDL